MTLQNFLSEWNSDTPAVKVRTSGSTGAPKEMLVEKERMVNSARMTCDFLGLKSGDKALLCMPLDYIAGKMMVVRSVVAGMQIVCVEPSGHPLAGLDSVPDFAAMTPMQVARTFENVDEIGVFNKIRCVIIGGGPIDPSLEEQLKSCSNEVWSTYGMTETLSHVALRRISGHDASLWYSPLSGVEISVSDDGALVVDAPMLHDGKLFTNDIAEINEEGQFRIIGRRDNVINSGGVKIHIEEVEERIKTVCPSLDFIITSRLDPVFGEVVVALLPKTYGESDVALFKNATETLPAYWRPKTYVYVDSLPYTETGKPNRAMAKSVASINTSY